MQAWAFVRKAFSLLIERHQDRPGGKLRPLSKLPIISLVTFLKKNHCFSIASNAPTLMLQSKMFQ